ncbi:MAG: polysaccharide lyase [Onishia taeanensis]|uniref:polysaccharide lyase n=1 Tax=Onishia taeanensis TaxID=284577 RepID=UPI003C7995C0
MSNATLLRAQRPLSVAFTAAVLCLLPLAAAMADEDTALGTPTQSACSQRYPLVAATSPEVDAKDAQAAIRQGFSTHKDWGTDQNAEILGAHQTGLGEAGLRVHYPANTSSPGDTDIGGAGFYAAPASLAGAETACLSYQVRFAPGFNFVKGGKLPGLFGGEAPSGGEEANGKNGFSMRYMWRKNGQGELYEYAVDQGEEYGKSVGRGLWSFPTGRWMTLEQEIVLNDPGQANGIARVWVDGRPILEQRGIIYRTTSDVTIDGLMFSTFFGGHGEDWRTPSDQHADFAAFRFYAPTS